MYLGTGKSMGILHKISGVITLFVKFGMISPI